MRRLILFLVSAVLSAVALTAAAAADVPPTLRAVRVAKPPVLDGRLDDAAWSAAVPFTAFRQAIPEPGGEPSEKTELRIVYDDRALYLGVHCRDRAPGRISANTMAHDGGGDEEHSGDDIIQVLLDPFLDMRNAYLFVVNPRGARREGLAFGEHFSLDWDGIWDARAELRADGWSCEIEIPFRTIAFKDGLPHWGLNVERYIPRKQETIRLAGIRRDAYFYNATEAARLEGIAGVRQGLGLTFRPYGTFSAGRDLTAGAAASSEFDGGFDLYKNITPNFVAAVSYNTDFAQTEVDERRINLTRFPLYFPEKRAFFLEGSEIFNFAGSNNSETFSPFFSRRVGLLEGRAVPLQFGVKVFGKVGDTNISLLDVGTRAAGGVPGRNFAAGRIYQNVLAESKVGFLFTSGSPDGTRNTLAGLDWTYQTSRLGGDQNLSVIGWYVYNWNGLGAGRHDGYGLKIDYPNDLWDINSSYGFYGDALAPGLGFLPRPGVQNFNLGISYQPRPSGGRLKDLVRQFFFELRFTYYWDLAGRLETRRVFTAPLNLRTESGEHIEFNVIPIRDVLPFDFEIADGIVLPRRAYDFTSFGIQFESALHRPWQVSAEWKFGPFYSGTCDNVELGFTYKLKGYATLALNAEFVRGRLPQGRFAENVWQLKADFFASPDLGLMNYIQYDDVSRRLGWNMRLRWQLSPGNEIFFVYSRNWERRWDPQSRFFPLDERGVFKIQFSVRP
jgi:hypothetical protein